VVNGAPEPFGCHYLMNIIAVPSAQAGPARDSLDANGIDATQFNEDMLSNLMPEIDPDLIVQMLNVVAPFEVLNNDPLSVSLTLRGDNVEGSPVHSVGFLHHIYVKPGTDASPIAGTLPPVSDSDRDPVRVVAIVDSGIVHQEFLPEWMRPDNTRFDPIDVETLDSPLSQSPGMTESHGTFVAALIRQISPAHTVSIARAKRVPIEEFTPLPPQHWPAPLPTSELDVLAAILRLINRHDGEFVEALNLSLGAYTCDPQYDWHLVTMAEALLRWQENHPESVIFAAGGNIPGSVPIWPAAYSFVRAVGAAGNDGTDQIVWDPVAQNPQPADPRFWISDVAPGSRVVSLSGQSEDALVEWSGSSFASPIAAALHVLGKDPNWSGNNFWWPAKPVAFLNVVGLSFEENGVVRPP
jgi:Subtilase family